VTSPRKRTERLGRVMEDRSLDLFLVTNLVNVRYLSGFTGTHGVCLIGRSDRIFITDFRYVERSSREVPDFERLRGKQDLLGDVAEAVVARTSGDVRLGFEEDNLTVARHKRLRELLPERVELVGERGMVESLRAVKDEDELRAIRAAAALTDDLYRWLLEEHGLTGRTERDVARALERRAQDIGAERAAFPPIVAAAQNGALPHSDPGDDVIERGTLVVVDLGCVVDGYCSDCTRTFATGEPEAEARDVYEVVRSAQVEALAAVRAGVEAEAVDRVARDKIEVAGWGDEFGHGTGHGVGMEVHETPRLGTGSRDRLESGNVVTIEPGVYVPGRFGVRIEDLVIVREDSSEVLTSIPKELSIV
jgi:Xaa-Pro aminopeptidase